MFSAINYIFFISTIALLANAAKLPETFKTCKKSDPKYQECINAAVEDALVQLKQGLPALNVPKIEPLFVEKIHIGGNGGKVDIEQDYTDLNIHGFSDTKVQNIDLLLDGDQCQIKMTTLTPTLRLDGGYKMVGKVLILTINGFGGTNITLTNLLSEHVVDCEKAGDKNGKQILKLGNYDLVIKTEKIKYEFENLVNGNPELSAEVLKVINDNSLDIFEEIRKDYARTFAQILKHVAAFILTKVPYEEYYFQ